MLFMTTQIVNPTLLEDKLWHLPDVLIQFLDFPEEVIEWHGEMLEKQECRFYLQLALMGHGIFIRTALYICINIKKDLLIFGRSFFQCLDYKIEIRFSSCKKKILWIRKKVDFFKDFAYNKNRKADDIPLV